MTQDAGGQYVSLGEELRATLACLAHARQALRQDGLEHLDDFWPRIERCAERIAELGLEERRGLQPMLLALLDEVEVTIAAFAADFRQLREILRSTHRSQAAGAAYRQIRTR